MRQDPHPYSITLMEIADRIEQFIQDVPPNDRDTVLNNLEELARKYHHAYMSHEAYIRYLKTLPPVDGCCAQRVVESGNRCGDACTWPLECLAKRGATS
jgi:hypothetical protein